MKNIILQHWAGELDDICTLSSTNIQKYAKLVNADYKLLRGNVFRPNLSPQCQKLFMLDESFDEYDTVVMLDADMFTRKEMDKNIFDENIEGVGMHMEVQARLLSQVCSKFPSFANKHYSYWGGAIYKLNRDLRQLLRSHINDKEMIALKGVHHDEIIMHRLAVLAKIKNMYLPDGKKWCYGSYEDGIENSYMIHIRTKTSPHPKSLHKPKIENYKKLISRGLIEE